MRREAFRFSDEPLRNILVSGDGTVLQLTLKQGQCVAKRRVRGASLLVVIDGQICVTANGREEQLQRADAVVLDPAEEHAMKAKADSVVLMFLLPKTSTDASMYRQGTMGDAIEDWKERIAPELHVIALAHERVAAACDGVEPFELETLDRALGAVVEVFVPSMQAEEDVLFPLLVPHLGGEDVGPVPKLRAEHREIRSKVAECQQLRTELNENLGQLQTLFYVIDELTQLIFSHLEKEDFHLLPMAGRLLSNLEKRAFAEQWETVYDVGSNRTG